MLSNDASSSGPRPDPSVVGVRGVNRTHVVRERPSPLTMLNSTLFDAPPLIILRGVRLRTVTIKTRQVNWGLDSAGITTTVYAGDKVQWIWPDGPTEGIVFGTRRTASAGAVTIPTDAATGVTETTFSLPGVYVPTPFDLLLTWLFFSAWCRLICLLAWSDFARMNRRCPCASV